LVKQQLAAVRMLFDWLVVGQVVPANPASAVRGPKHVVKTGKTPMLEAEEWRKLLETIPAITLRNFRDRALIATLTYSFARVTAALKMEVEDLRPRGAAGSIRLHEKGGKHHTMPCHHALAAALHAYINAARIAQHRKEYLFRTSRGHNGNALSDQAMDQSAAWGMIRRRAAAAGIHAPIGNHAFRAIGITLTFRTAVRSSTPKKWRRTKGGARPSSMTEPKNGSPRTKRIRLYSYLYLINDIQEPAI
jgi:site-specific recombinase XerD